MAPVTRITCRAAEIRSKRYSVPVCVEHVHVAVTLSDKAATARRRHDKRSNLRDTRVNWPTRWGLALHEGRQILNQLSLRRSRRHSAAPFHSPLSTTAGLPPPSTSSTPSGYRWDAHRLRTSKPVIRNNNNNGQIIWH